MSIVIIGGHDRVVCTYKGIYKQLNYKAKAFTQQPASLKIQIGCPDLPVLFTSTVSHQMVHSALQMTKNTGTAVVHSHSSNSYALRNILAKHYC